MLVLKSPHWFPMPMEWNPNAACCVNLPHPDFFYTGLPAWTLGPHCRGRLPRSSLVQLSRPGTTFPLQSFYESYCTTQAPLKLSLWVTLVRIFLSTYILHTVFHQLLLFSVHLLHNQVTWRVGAQSDTASGSHTAFLACLLISKENQVLQILDEYIVCEWLQGF